LSDLAAAVLLGIVQGLTEFLPVSSTAHLILVSDLLKLDPERFGLSFDVALHLGTALAVLLYFARTWIELIVGLFRGKWRMPALIVLGTAPAAVAGVLFQSAIEREMRGPLVIAAGLVVGSVVFVVAEAIARQRRAMSEVGVVDALIIGIAQAIALIPGISRSGITMGGGLIVGLSNEDAARYAFLLATPIIGAAAALKLPELFGHEGNGVRGPALVGALCAAVTTYFAVKFLLRFFENGRLTPFGIYCIVVGTILTIAFAIS
jgi:undecaprenyl-diphosphatase